jgi:glycosyltransferase involved in cell wall biosynthesis
MLWMKGVGDFVEAAKLAGARGIKARFVLAGDTDPSNPLCIPRQQLLGWQASGIIEWWGHRDQMQEVFEQAAVVCLPSHGGEGTPQVLMEAAASGRALVTTDVPGCRDVVQNGVNGFVVQPRNPGALAAAIEKLLSDPGMRIQMASQSRELALREFAEEAVVRQSLALYDDLIGSAGLRVASAPVPDAYVSWVAPRSRSNLRKA